MRAVVLFLGCVIGLALQSTEVIDLTRVGPSSGMSGGRGPCMASGSGGRPAAPPLGLTLLGFERSEYRVGERLAGEILIENRGQTAETIPVSSFTGKQPSNRLRMMNIALAARGPQGIEQSLGGWITEGASDVKDTIRELRPGGAIRIKFPVPSIRGLKMFKEPGSALTVSVSASVAIQIVDCQWTTPVKSNAVSLQVRTGRE
jgi:hypothetical protein